ncbi:mammalian cell entry protein [Mycolicibacter nonchromogenicus]|uniref:Mammalian cell entry protein n=1 Tax=Mycolicibacter nonchromogenicus TaxID=1782 RepID=A0A1X1YXZ5_MYCNO|nr:tetratricopeptide repeat protein [Mycolicibacter nonchromogenicus]OBI07280.1 mammalian cell entry protein [Mycolicibacter heraklionensis]ORW15923.1 mammalian cell entry protein [Mycolicibacter nonchromogenicus]
MADPAAAPGRVGRRVAAAASVAVAALAGAVGWLGYRDHQIHQAQEQRESYVQVARQAAINLTTISYAQADADVQRIIDSTTGEFRDDFAARSRPFLDVVRQAQSESEGTVTEAGLESVDGDRADVLLAVSVRTTIAGTVQPEPRHWRMRISLQRTDDGPKVSNIGFVQ